MDVGGQGSERGSVRCDVMHDDGEHMFGLGDSIQSGPQWYVSCHVESGAGKSKEPLRRFGFGDVMRNQIEIHRRLGQDFLARTVRGIRIVGTQRLVALDHVTKRESQRRRVQGSAQTQRQGQVVRGSRGVESIEEPHPILRR